MATKFARDKLAEEIVHRLDRGQSAKKISQAVAAYLISINKTSELSSLLRDIMQKRSKKDGIVEVNCVSAKELDTSAKREIEKIAKRHYTNTKQVIIHEKVDPQVIGGISLSFVNSSLDLTVRAKLNKLRTLTT